jgi:uncharacterized protein Smg (DUF494 family)
MQEKIVEIILHLITGIRDHKNVEESVIKKLVDKGYTQTEISAAFSWIYDKIQFGESILADTNQKAASHSYRVFHEAEKMVFTPEARGYLIQCYELGLIDEWDIEFIIDRSTFSGFSKIGLDEIKSFVASAVFNYDDSDRIGSRLMLSSKDTIH